MHSIVRIMTAERDMDKVIFTKLKNGPNHLERFLRMITIGYIYEGHIKRQLAILICF